MRLPLSLRIAAAVLAAVLAAIAAFAAWASRHYFTAAEVDRAAYPLEGISLPYPTLANGTAYAGTLRLNVYIGRDGAVDAVELVDATVPAAYQDVALRAFRAARFGPARWHGLAVRSVKRIEVTFIPPTGGSPPLR